MAAPVPGHAFPEFDLPRVGGGRIDNSIFAASKVTILNSYRGLHCPRCERQLQEIVARSSEFAEYGAQIVSFSTDGEDRATQAAADWGLGDMPVGHSLTLPQARAFGLFVSESIREGEPGFFAEPGVFIVTQDGKLWGSVVGTFPFIRPNAEQLLDALNALVQRDYPARGTIAA